jgi:hypothetical protein
MPCSEPRIEHREQMAADAAEHLLYLEDATPLKLGSAVVKMLKGVDARTIGPDLCDELTRILCDACKVMEGYGDDATKYIYNGHDPRARRLADWWDEHKKIDQKKWWCTVHERQAKNALGCDSAKGGILLPCKIIVDPNAD